MNNLSPYTQGWELASRLGVAKGDYEALAMSWLEGPKKSDSQCVMLDYSKS